MHRAVAFIAILFAIASLAGTTTAHAHRYVSTPIVVLNHVDDQNVPILVMVQIQRGEIDLGAGIFLPCGPHQAIPVTAPILPDASDGDDPVARLSPQSAPWAGERLLRPPISARA